MCLGWEISSKCWLMFQSVTLSKLTIYSAQVVCLYGLYIFFTFMLLLIHFVAWRHLNKWMNEWMNKWMNEWMNEWILRNRTPLVWDSSFKVSWRGEVFNGAFPLHGTVRFGTARYGTVRLSSGRFAFPPQFSTAIEWAGLFTRRYNCAASTAVTSS